MNNQKAQRALILAEDARSLILTRREILLAMLGLGIEIDVAVPADEHCETLKQMGCQIIGIAIDRRGLNPIKDLKLFWTLKRIASAKPYDFAFTYAIKPNIYGGFALKQAGVTFYTNITGIGTAMHKDGLLRSFICFLYRFVTPFAAGVFFENSGNRDSFVKWKLCTKEQTHVFPGAGINVEQFEFCPYPKIIDRVKVLYIGRLMPEKGINELCQAARHFNDANFKVDFELAGACEESYKHEFDTYLATTPNLKYLGFLADVRPAIRDAHAILLPSYHEGMANVLLEGGALGRPLLASNIHGCKEAIVDGANGLLFDVKDTASLIQTISAFLASPYEKKVAMGAASHTHIVANFDRKSIVTNILRLLKQTIDCE